MTQKELQKELKELREEIKRLTDELRCARCPGGPLRPVPMPYYPAPYIYPYQPYVPYTPDWSWGSTTTITGTASDTFTITS